MDKQKNDIDALILDALLERPVTFKIGKRNFSIYPPSMGKNLMIARKLSQMDINQELLAHSAVMETLRLATQEPQAVAEIITLAVCRTKEEIFDINYFTNVCDIFQECEPDTRASLFSFILGLDHTNEFIKHFGIDEDIRLMQRAEQIKQRNDTSLNFCGKSAWGAQIDWAAERYGWTYDYIVWGISYTALQMLMMDYSKNVYLTDEERKHMHIPRPGDEVIKVDEMSYEEFMEKGLKFD